MLLLIIKSFQSGAAPGGALMHLLCGLPSERNNAWGTYILIHLLHVHSAAP